MAIRRGLGDIEDGYIFSISSIRGEYGVNLSAADGLVAHSRIPGVTMTLHTSTAVIFTNRLRGVKTCNLCTREDRACVESSSKLGSFHP